MLSSIKVRQKNLQLSKVEVSLLFFIFLIGLPMIVLIPPGAGYDEEDHLVRVWELSAASFIPGAMSPQEMKYPTVFRDFAYRQQRSTGIVDTGFWQKYARASLYESGFVHREIKTKSVYSPALLLPQAIVMRLLGRDLDLPALPVLYACRLASLFSYLILVWLAIRWMPFGRWIVLVLAVIPMALFQAATVSPDAISNGIGFLFLAGCLRATSFQEIHWKEFGYFVLLIALLFLAKLNLIPLILLLFLLITPSRFSQKRIYVLLLITAAMLFLVEAAGWNLIATRHVDPVLANGANLTGQLIYVASHPFAFLRTLLHDLLTNGLLYLQGWLNGYGYYYWTPPSIVSFLFLLSLIAALWSDPAPESLNRTVRLALIVVFVVGYFATIVSLYLTFTPVGSAQVFGVQGRYFIPLAPLLFLAAANLPWLGRFRIVSTKWLISSITAALVLNVLGIFLSFYVPCGSTFYQTGLCYQPLFKAFSNDAHVSQPLSNEISLAQEIQVKCDGFTELRLWTLPPIPGDKGNTHFILRETASGQTLLDTTVTNNQIIMEDWHPLRFRPDWHSAGKQYILEISGTDAPGQGLKLLYTPQSEFDQGTLYENGMPTQEDIILQYGCATGLRKIWLTGKP